jgi:RIO kinase 2
MLYPKEKLDEELKRLRKNDLKVLLAVEQGMKTYEFVPKDYIVSYTKIQPKYVDYYLVDLVDRGLLKILKTKNYVGFQLTYLGYDILAFTWLLSKGYLETIGDYIETGKEADILSAKAAGSRDAVAKVYHIGRTSFYRVWRHRIYVVDKRHLTWQYISYLTARREFELTRRLWELEYPVPEPIAWNRNVLVYEQIKEAKELGRLQELPGDPEELYWSILNTYLDIVKRLGLVHGDFSVFNVLLDSKGRYWIIDWGQAIEAWKPGAVETLRREVHEFTDFFIRKHGVKLQEEKIEKLINEALRSAMDLRPRRPLEQ